MLHKIHSWRHSCSLNLIINLYASSGTTAPRCNHVLPCRELPNRDMIFGSHKLPPRNSFAQPAFRQKRQQPKRRQQWTGGYSLQAWSALVLHPQSLWRCRARPKRWLRYHRGPPPPCPLFPISTLRMTMPRHRNRIGRMHLSLSATPTAAAGFAGGAAVAAAPGGMVTGAADAAGCRSGCGSRSVSNAPLRGHLAVVE